MYADRGRYVWIGLFELEEVMNIMKNYSFINWK